MIRRPYPIAALLCLVAPVAGAGEAGPDWSRCAVVDVVPAPPPWEGDPAALGPQTLELFADEADLVEEGASTLRGDVRVLRGEERLHGEVVVYDRGADAMDIAGSVQYWTPGTYLSGSRAHYEFGTGEGWLDEVSFRLGDEHARGAADTVRISTADVLLMEQVSYTTCSPQAEDWRLDAGSIKLDREIDVGVARDVKVTFKGVPIFYSPYLSFPLTDTRKSGFLAPTIGQSTETGLDVTIPYYWNIAPERDATFAARHMSDRGTMLMGEYRYLLDDEADGGGHLNIEYLPDDDEFGDDRSLIKFYHRQRLNTHWRTLVEFQNLSDDDYLDDLGTGLDLSSTQFLRRAAELTYIGYGGYVTGLVEGYQTIDENIGRAGEPYRRLPLIYGFWGKEFLDRRLKLHVYGDFASFDHGARVDGDRYNLKPSISYHYRTPGAFLIPKLSYQYTSYDLNDPAAGTPSSLDRALPLFSVDGGLIFERLLKWGRRSYLQTLEPRLFYLYVPERDQDDIPVFDTGEFTFSFAQLFREDRFSGADRVNDANQVAAAVTTRVLDDDGNERLRGSIGRIYYLEDRDVTLQPNAPDLTADTSDLVAEVAAEFAHRWQLRLGLQWDEDNNWTEKGTTQLRYQPNEEAVVNLAYRFVRDFRDDRRLRVTDRTIEQTDVSGRWPLSRATAVVGRWAYELTEDRTLESFIGLEYESCCWAMRAVARRYLADDGGVPGADPEYSSGFFVQLELKGLGGVGGGAASFLRQQIPGYRNNF